jgi:hypothetical protein
MKRKPLLGKHIVKMPRAVPPAVIRRRTVHQEGKLCKSTRTVHQGISYSCQEIPKYPQYRQPYPSEKLTNTRKRHVQCVYACQCPRIHFSRPKRSHLKEVSPPICLPPQSRSHYNATLLSRSSNCPYNPSYNKLYHHCNVVNRIQVQ